MKFMRTTGFGEIVGRVVVGLAFALYGCGSTSPQGRVGDCPDVPSMIIASRTHEAAASFAEVAAKYAGCQTYRDRGTVVETSRAPDGSWGSTIGRFDTTFIRDNGIRFRYFDESGHLLYAVWARGNDVKKWMRGVVDAASPSVMNAMATLKGVTGLASWVAFKLLTGISPAPSSLCGPWYVDAQSCARCPNVVFKCPSQVFALMYTLDLREDVVRRFYVFGGTTATANPKTIADGHDPLVVAVLPPREPPLLENQSAGASRNETLLLYDWMEFDGDERVVAAELNKVPW